MTATQPTVSTTQADSTNKAPRTIRVPIFRGVVESAGKRLTLDACDFIDNDSFARHVVMMAAPAGFDFGDRVDHFHSNGHLTEYGIAKAPGLVVEKIIVL